MKPSTLLLVFICAALAQSNNPAQPARRDGITVTDAPTDQDRLQREYAEKIKQAQQFTAQGDTQKALALLDAAQEMTAKNRFLGGYLGFVLQAKGQIYLQRGESERAVASLQKRFELVTEDCRRAVADGVPFSYSCAEAHVDLANAQLVAGNYVDALNHASRAADNYRLCARVSPATSEVARLVCQARGAGALLIGGAASTRLGKQNDARELFESAIKTLEMVVSDPKSNDNVRAYASNLLTIAKQQAPRR